MKISVVRAFAFSAVSAFLVIASGCQGSLLSPTSFRLDFPNNVDVGELRLVEDVNCFTCGTGDKYLGRGTGSYDIELPAAHWYVSLKMPRNASALLPYLATPSLAQIGEINLQNSDVQDGDLRHLAAMRLRSIDLSRTSITGAGLQYLKPNDRWTFVNLRDCPSLDPKYLAHFNGWTRSTIRIVGYKSSTQSYSDQELRLLTIARQVICDGQSEDSCGTQIR